MTALVLGGTGMLGHVLWGVLARRLDTWATVRDPGRIPTALPADRALRASVESFDSVVAAFEKARPDVVVNCIGIVKQAEEAHDPISSIGVNSLFPHRLAHLAGAADARVIHISTDCVFSGRKGLYTEDDVPDAEDLYGRSKLLGEIVYDHTLTLRTSIVGPELGTAHGLLAWFLSQHGATVSGFTRAVFSGLTTRALSAVIAELVEEHADLSGLYHVAGAPISKHDLLVEIARIWDVDVEIEPSERVVVDRSLDGARFANVTGIEVPAWDEMIRDLGLERRQAGRSR